MIFGAVNFHSPSFVQCWVCHKAFSYDIMFAVFLREICSKFPMYIMY